MLGLSGGDDILADVEVFRDAFGITFPILLDAAAVYSQYGQPGGATPFPLDYVIDREGIVVYHNQEYDPEGMISVIDGLLGNEAVLETDPEWLSFSAVEVGQSGELLLDVFNTGSGVLQVHAMATGSDEFRSNLESLFIPGGQSRAVQISFLPEFAGTRIDTLWIASNDPLRPLHAVPLQGIGGDGVGVADPEFTRIGLSGEPNPFRTSTSLRFNIIARGKVWLEVFDIRGRKVRTLIGGESLTAGDHARPWDGRDDGGVPLSSGVYFSRLRGSAGSLTRKITLLR